MGDWHYLQLKCAHCEADNPSKEDYESDPMENGIYYAPSSGFADFKCRECGKTNWITEGFYAVKIEIKKELDELYKQEGFE